MKILNHKSKSKSKKKKKTRHGKKKTPLSCYAAIDGCTKMEKTTTIPVQNPQQVSGKMRTIEV